MLKIRNGPKIDRCRKGDDVAVWSAGARFKVLQWMMHYTDFSKISASVSDVLFDKTHLVFPSEREEREGKEGKEFYEIAACNMDHRVFQQSLNVLCFRLLKVS